MFQKNTFAVVFHTFNATKTLYVQGHAYLAKFSIIVPFFTSIVAYDYLLSLK